MKKVIAALAVIGALASCNESKKTVAKPQTYMDSVSYMLGSMLSEGVDGQVNQYPFKDSINMEFLKAGLKDALDSNKVFSDSVLTLVRDDFGQKFQAAAQKEQMEAQIKQMAELESKKGEFMPAHDAYMAKVASYPGIKKTESGIYYKVVRKGKGKKPASAQSRVKVNYEGKLVDGTKFDSSYDRGEPATFGLNQVIKGWTEGIQLMNEGSEFEFYFPYDLAYGAQGNGSIPPYSPLYFRVELIEVQ